MLRNQRMQPDNCRNSCLSENKKEYMADIYVHIGVFLNKPKQNKFEYNYIGLLVPMKYMVLLPNLYKVEHPMLGKRHNMNFYMCLGQTHNKHVVNYAMYYMLYYSLLLFRHRRHCFRLRQLWHCLDS